jgi:hypothetical protein
VKPSEQIAQVFKDLAASHPLAVQIIQERVEPKPTTRDIDWAVAVTLKAQTDAIDVVARILDGLVVE